jgi:predicted transcriptional regulator of viral defense system
MNDTMTRAIRVFRDQGGIMRTAKAMGSGVHPRTLYAMKDRGTVVELSRGVYRLAELPELQHQDLAAVAMRVPKGVVCLVSALAYHDATDQIPHEVQIALPRGTPTPKIHHPPIRVFRFSEPTYSDGVELAHFDGVTVKVYSLGKTVVDCFKFRNKIGLDVAIEGLRSALTHGVSAQEILAYARNCRMFNTILPYVEALA